MKRILLLAVAFVLLGASAVRADVLPPPPPPPPKPPTKPGPALDPTITTGAAAGAGIVLAGAWIARSQRRVRPLN